MRYLVVYSEDINSKINTYFDTFLLRLRSKQKCKLFHSINMPDTMHAQFKLNHCLMMLFIFAQDFFPCDLTYFLHTVSQQKYLSSGPGSERVKNLTFPEKIIIMVII